jgi:S-DNA-T family DNA segregation ATPase FtsK/SpoIIIE
MQPVPEPMVRDLSVPQSLPAPAQKKSREKDLPKEPAPAEEGVVISARDIPAATTADILGKDTAAEEADKESVKPRPEGEAASVPEAGAQDVAAPNAEDAGAASALPPAAKPKPAPRKPKRIAVAATPKIGNYQLPPLDFLQRADTSLKPTETREELMANARLMQQTLAQFDIEVSPGDITKGPTITRYELHPAPGVKLEKIVALSNNIAAALKAERINILAPVPGKSSVGVEVPNAIKTKVIVRDLFESEEWVSTKARIPVALGKDVYGTPIVADLAEMPHLLIAGSTGSGKSVCINAIIASLLYRFPPDKLRFVMIDPKVVELQLYNALPHLVVPVVTDPKKVILALRWVVNEMEKRYQIFARVGVRNIRSFNERPKHKPVPAPEPELPLVAKREKVEVSSEGFAVELDEDIVVPRDEEIVIPDYLSYIVVIIDELADLMLVAPADVEMAIARITQMARAAGIHCIVATQRPSVDVITGVIKANISARIAFQVAAKVDSRTILDAMGADKLLGKGDMLYSPPGSAKLIRIQGTLITDAELQNIVDFIAKQGKPSYEVDIHQQLQKAGGSLDGEPEGSGEDEELIQQCIEVIRSEQKASVSLLQRRLRLGYTRAARIMDELEMRGIVGPNKGAEPRDILIDLDHGGADGNPPPGSDEGSAP